MLELELLEESGQLMGTLGYNLDLFKESTVIRIAEQFQVCHSSAQIACERAPADAWSCAAALFR